MAIVFDLPSTQIGFAAALQKMRDMYLQDALSAVVASMEIDRIDAELHACVDNRLLQILAAQGMRGEQLFAVPCILENDPRLLGYYRLLLGYSQKGFYTAATGAGMFKSLEERGALSRKQREALPALCAALNKSAAYMMEHLERRMISPAF